MKTHALGVLALRLVEGLTRRRGLHIQPRVVVAVDLLAALFVSALWLAGADGGAMRILLVSILFPLIAAAWAHDPESGVQRAVIRLLIHRGADVNETDKNGVTPLHRAVRFRSPAAVRILLESGADPNAERSGSGGPSLDLTLGPWRGRKAQGVIQRSDFPGDRRAGPLSLGMSRPSPE